MGYQTTFQISIHGPEDEKELARQAIFDFMGYPADEYPEDYFIGPLKWYSTEKDIEKISKTCPSCYFEIKGWGEQQDDIWILYAKDGKVQVEEAKIVYPPPDFKQFT